MSNAVEVLGCISFGIGIVVITIVLYYLYLRFKKEIIQDVLDCKREIFDLSKEIHFLTQEKAIHDEKVNNFIVNLQFPTENQGASSKELTEDLNIREAKFKSLLAKEEFLLLCKERIAELINILQARYSKSIDLVMEILGLSGKKKVKALKGIVGTLLSKKSESAWPTLIDELKRKGENLKGNKNLLIHSFSSWEKEIRDKLLNLEGGVN